MMTRLLPQRLASRLALTFGALFVATLTPVVVLTVFIAGGWLETALDDHLLTVARDLAERLEQPGADPQAVVEQLSSPSQVIEVRQPGGPSLARSSRLEGRRLPVTVGLASEEHQFNSVSFEGGRLRVLVHPLALSEEGVTYAVVATPLPGLRDQIRELIVVIVVIGVVALVVALAATWVIARWLTRPLRQLAAQVRANATAPQGRPIMVDGRASAEVRALAEAIRQLSEEQRQRLERERSFFADSSHVLRTPLAVLQGNLDLLDGSSEHARRDAVEQARSAVLAISRTVGGLLLLSREEERVGAWRIVDLSALLERLGAEFQRAWPGRPLSRAIEPGVEVAADGQRLRELFEAVLENAGHYTREGGAVRIVCRREGEEATVEVLDEGIGLSPDEARRATERFFRGYEARMMAPGGSGLGLAIAQRIAQMHGGDLRIEAREDRRGARVTVTLPAFV
jgi:signal transduction histidine kinase